jgi:hypothetical protein
MEVEIEIEIEIVIVNEIEIVNENLFCIYSVIV